MNCCVLGRHQVMQSSTMMYSKPVLQLANSFGTCSPKRIPCVASQGSSPPVIPARAAGRTMPLPPNMAFSMRVEPVKLSPRKTVRDAANTRNVSTMDRPLPSGVDELKSCPSTLRIECQP